MKRPLTLALLFSPSEPDEAWDGKIFHCGHRAVRIDPAEWEDLGRGAEGAYDLILVPGAGARKAHELWRRYPVPVVVVYERDDRRRMDRLPPSWSCLTEPVSQADLEAAIWTAIGNFDRLCAASRELARIERELERGWQPEEAERAPSDFGGEQR